MRKYDLTKLHTKVENKYPRNNDKTLAIIVLLQDALLLAKQVHQVKDFVEVSPAVEEAEKDVLTLLKEILED